MDSTISPQSCNVQ